jgi:hypothetical protein
VRLGRGFTQLLSEVTSKAALSWPVLVMCTALSVFIHLFTANDIPTGNYGVRVAAAAISVLPMFATIWLAFRVPAKSALVRSLIVYLSFVLGGGLRGATLSLLLEYSGVIEPGEIGFRILAGMVSMSNSIAVLTYFWGSFSKLLASIQLQQAEIREISRSLDLIAEESSEHLSEQAAGMSNEIISTLAELRVQSTDDQAVSITRLIEERVRPLSQSLAGAAQSERESEDHENRVSPRVVFSRLKPAENIPPAWLALVIAATPFAIALDEFGFGRALLVSTLVALILFPLVRIARKNLGPQLAKLSRPKQFLLVFALFALMGLLGSLGSYLALLGTENPTLFVLPGAAAFLIFSWITMLSLAAVSALRELQGNLETLANRMRWASARASLVSLHNRRSLAKFLHGPVQASLHAVVFRLKSQSETGSDSGILEDITNRLKEAQNLELGFDDFLVELRNFESIWEGLAEVDIQLTSEVKELLRADNQLSSFLLELCGQHISTAIRKLSASSVIAKIELTSDGQLKVALTDNRIADLSDDESQSAELITRCSIESGKRLNSQGLESYYVLPALMP